MVIPNTEKSQVTCVPMCNDINRIISIYVVTFIILSALGFDKMTGPTFRTDMLSDLIAVSAYYQAVKTTKWDKCASALNEYLPEALGNNLMKSTMLVLVSTLVSGTFRLENLVAVFVAVVLYHLAVRKFVLSLVDKYELNEHMDCLEDTVETVLMLSVGNNNIKDTLSKGVGVLLYHFWPRIVRS